MRLICIRWSYNNIVDCLSFPINIQRAHTHTHTLPSKADKKLTINATFTFEYFALLTSKKIFSQNFHHHSSIFFAIFHSSLCQIFGDYIKRFVMIPKEKWRDYPRLHLFAVPYIRHFLLSFFLLDFKTVIYHSLFHSL